MKRLFLVLSASVVLLLTPAAAQMPPPPGFLSVTEVAVRPAAVPEFEDYVKKIHAAAAKIGLKDRVDGYQVVQGGSPFMYNFVSLQPSMAAFDAIPPVPAIILKAYGEAEGRKIQRAGAAAIESVETRMFRYLDALSTKPRAAENSAFFQVVLSEIDPAMTAEYHRYMEKSKAAGDKAAGAPTVFRYQGTFGPGFSYGAALPFNAWAERDKWADRMDVLKTAYGEAEAMKIEESRLRAVKTSTNFVLARRADLSRVPTTTSY